MPPTRRQPMLPDHRDFPESILYVLNKQRFESGTGMIRHHDPWRLPDLSAVANEPQIQFVILVTNQSRIEQSEPQQCRSPPAAIGHSVNIAFVIFAMKPRAAAGESRVK